MTGDISVPVSAAELSDLIGSIYDRVLDPNGWGETLDRIRASLRCETAVLHLTNMREDSELIYAVSGMSQEWTAQVQSHLPEIRRDLTNHLYATRSLDEPHIMSRHVPDSAWESSAYARECLVPNKIVDVIQYCLAHSTARYAAIGIGRHERQGIITDCEIETGALLLPHIRRAVSISNILAVRTIEAARMTQTLDSVGCGVIFSDRSAKIVHANEAAHTMLQARELIADRGGILQASIPSAARELRAGIQTALAEPGKMPDAARPIRLTPRDVPPVFAHVMPLSRRVSGAHMRASDLAAIFISIPNAGDDAADAMAGIFGLTPAEANVARFLGRGMTLTESAAALGVAPATAKTHLDRIFLKTGVNRQADLMRLLAQVAPPLRR